MPTNKYTWTDEEGALGLTDEGHTVLIRWLRRNVGDYLDDCNEVDTTRLAEAAADALKLYRDPENADVDDHAAKIPDQVYDLALELAEDYEERLQGELVDEDGVERRGGLHPDIRAERRGWDF